MYSTKSENIITSILFLVFGLILCFFSISLLKTFTCFLGILTIVISICFLYSFYTKRESTSLASLLIGICLLCCGLYMAFFSEQFLSTLPMLVGIVLIINSFVHFQKTLILKDNGFSMWKMNFGCTILILVIGIILLMKPIQSLDIIFKLIGIFLIMNAIIILLNQFLLDKTDSTYLKHPDDDL